jgi:hypothetical protein
LAPSAPPAVKQFLDQKSGAAPAPAKKKTPGILVLTADNQLLTSKAATTKRATELVGSFVLCSCRLDGALSHHFATLSLSPLSSLSSLFFL